MDILSQTLQLEHDAAVLDGIKLLIFFFLNSFLNDQAECVHFECRIDLIRGRFYLFTD